MSIDQANRSAVERMTSARPMLTAVDVAKEVIPDLGERMLLHAGPPITWDRMSGPLKGAVIGAILYEGWAKDETKAAAMAEQGEVAFEP